MKFYKQMIELDQHEGSYLAICKHFRAIGDTPVVKEDPVKRNEVSYVNHHQHPFRPYLLICKLRKRGLFIIHDTECPYKDQVSSDKTVCGENFRKYTWSENVVVF